MLICHCENVNDRRIREAVSEGARTVAQVGRKCGAGTCCGGCVRAVVELIESSDFVDKATQGTPLPITAAPITAAPIAAAPIAAMPIAAE